MTDTSYSFKGEMSLDGNTWQTMLQGKATRTGR
jgi:hypothetical protein